MVHIESVEWPCPLCRPFLLPIKILVTFRLGMKTRDCLTSMALAQHNCFTDGDAIVYELKSVQ